MGKRNQVTADLRINAEAQLKNSKSFITKSNTEVYLIGIRGTVVAITTPIMICDIKEKCFYC